MERSLWVGVESAEARRHRPDPGHRRCKHFRFAGKPRAPSLPPFEAAVTISTWESLQFAKAAGARVIATTSSAAKAETLRKLGADTVINYKDNPDWGEIAKKASPHGLGVDHVLEVGGPKTMTQSLNATKPEGVISIIGFLGGMSKEQPSFLECLNKMVTVRGVLVGSRLQFENMNEAIDANGIKPVVDEKVFALEELKDAYQYMVSLCGVLCYRVHGNLVRDSANELDDSGIKSISAN